MIVGSDIGYDPSLFEPLCETLREQCHALGAEVAVSMFRSGHQSKCSRGRICLMLTLVEKKTRFFGTDFRKRTQKRHEKTASTNWKTSSPLRAFDSLINWSTRCQTGPPGGDSTRVLLALADREEEPCLQGRGVFFVFFSCFFGKFFRILLLLRFCFCCFFAFVAFLLLLFCFCCFCVAFLLLLLFCFCCFSAFCVFVFLLFAFVAFLLWQLFSFLFFCFCFSICLLSNFWIWCAAGGGRCAPPNPPRATKSALHLRYPRLPRNQYFKVNSPGHKLLTNHICLLCWFFFSLLFLC